MKVKKYKCPGCGAAVNKNQKVCSYCQTPLNFESEEKNSNYTDLSKQDITPEMQIDQIREQYNKAMNQIYKAKPKISYIMEIVFGLIFIGFNAIILSINLASGHTFLPFVIIPGILIFVALVSIIIVIKKFIKYKKNDKDK